MIPLLEARGVSKAFPGVQALADVSMHVRAGEVLAVVGENGAGKSTLMKILAGVYTPDSGGIFLDGQPVAIRSVTDAERLGIVLIHQELNLAEDLDVAGNVFLGREPTRLGWLRLLDRSIYARAEHITRRLGLEASPTTIVGRLPVGQQQLVEIARALSLESRVLILDEPTSSLTEAETDRLFAVLRELKRSGLSILYISHRLKEVHAIADRVTVLRDGRNAGELTRSEISHDAIVRLMVGRDLRQFFQRTGGRGPRDARPVFEARNLRWSPAQTRGISFQLRPGEIVGMAGLIGAGRTELAETIYGIRPRLSGDILIDGQRRTMRRPAQAIAAGIFLVPEDRRAQGLLLLQSVLDNATLPWLEEVSTASLVRTGAQRRLAETMCAQLRVRTPSIGQRVGLLSGGNQQKVVLARWLHHRPRLLILDEPTRGIDVGAKSEIYALMDRLAHEGVAILMISSDLEEVLGVSDRILVMHKGELAGEAHEHSEEAIMHLATGGAAS